MADEPMYPSLDDVEGLYQRIYEWRDTLPESQRSAVGVNIEETQAPSEDDVEGLMQRYNEWRGELPESERELLDALVVVRTPPPEDEGEEVSGHLSGLLWCRYTCNIYGTRGSCALYGYYSAVSYQTGGCARVCCYRYKY